MSKTLTIDCSRITDGQSFHEVFYTAMGFPEYYGRNMNAWIDCMTYLDDPDCAMTNIHVAPGQVLTLVLEGARELGKRCPEIYGDLIECAAFVNWRRLEVSEPAVLALAYHD